MKTLQLLSAGPRRQASARTSAESDEACQRKTKDRADGMREKSAHCPRRDSNLYLWDTHPPCCLLHHEGRARLASVETNTLDTHVCVCVRVCVCVCVRAHVRVSMCACVPAYLHVCLLGYTRLYPWACRCACTHLHACMWPSPPFCLIVILNSLFCDALEDTPGS